MDFSIKSFDAKNTIATSKTGVIAVGVFENKKLSGAARELDAKGALSTALKSGDISGKAGSTLLLRNLDGVAADRVLLVGLGKEEAISEKDFGSALEAVAKCFANLGAAEGTIALPLEGVKQRDTAYALHAIVMALHDQAYRSDGLKSTREENTNGIKKFKIAVDAKDATSSKAQLAKSLAIANGSNLTRDLGNLPGNYCTPAHLATVAKKLASDYKMEVDVLERKQIEALKMGSFLSVANGSDEPPKFIVLKHMGGKAKDAPIVLVGKGITFDSGGISLKPGPNMDEMKFDMCGAGTVLGTMRAIGEMQLKLNVIAVIATCENMPSGRATKPGDIVTSMAGLTIEVLNTDAEGRLILCDALTYAERFNPATVIDVATLTGACVIALGNHKSGLFTRHDEAHDQLADALLDAGKTVGDTAWRMPIEDIYYDQLKSNFADIANIGTPGAGSIVAAAFLERFTRKYTWAHLDIAGTAWKSGASKGATGRPVPLLAQFLAARAGK
jgi:leucyl aminopeptidase